MNTPIEHIVDTNKILELTDKGDPNKIQSEISITLFRAILYRIVFKIFTCENCHEETWLVLVRFEYFT